MPSKTAILQAMMRCASAGLLVSLGCAGPTTGIASRLSGTKLADNSPAAKTGQANLQQTSKVVTEEFRPTADKKARLDLALARMLDEAGNDREATKYYEQAVKNHEDVDTMLALANNYAALGRTDAALELYNKAARKYRKNPSVYNDLGLFHANQKDWDAAETALRKATELDPGNAKYHNNLGLVLAASQKYTEAYDAFSKAVGPGPAHYNLAWVLIQHDMENAARLHLNQALTYITNDADRERTRQLLASLQHDHPATPEKSSAPGTGIELAAEIDSQNPAPVLSKGIAVKLPEADSNKSAQAAASPNGKQSASRPLSKTSSVAQASDQQEEEPGVLQILRDKTFGRRIRILNR